jgi:hypothetical protein
LILNGQLRSQARWALTAAASRGISRLRPSGTSMSWVCTSVSSIGSMSEMNGAFRRDPTIARMRRTSSSVGSSACSSAVM